MTCFEEASSIKCHFALGLCSVDLRVTFLSSSQQNFRAQLYKPQHLSFQDQKECLGKLQRSFQNLHFMKHSHLPVLNTNASTPHKKLTPKKDMVLSAGADRRNLTLWGPSFFLAKGSQPLTSDCHKLSFS